MSHNAHYGADRIVKTVYTRAPERRVIDMIAHTLLHTLSGATHGAHTALVYGFRKRHGERRLN